LIKNLLILTTYGQIFYSQEFEKTEEAVDVALTGGLMSAIYSMATETQREKISEFELVTSRIIFQEERSDLLFVLTVDKRMDIQDTYELLEMISKRFFEKYGEIRIDGLVLTDFEEDATKIIYKKLWYLDTKKRKFRVWEYLATIFIALALSWYSLLIFGSAPFKGMPDFSVKTFVWGGLLSRLGNPGAFILYLLLLIGVIAIPAIIIYFLFKFTYVGDIFRFSRDYLTRPTRASYAELLPNHFLINIFVSFVLYVSFMIFSGGYFSEIKVYILSPGNLINELDDLFDFRTFNVGQSDVGDQMLIGLMTWFTWMFVFPFLYSIMLGDKRWKTIYKNSVFIASIAIFILTVGSAFGGLKYLEGVGFHPSDPAQFVNETRQLTYVLAVTIPLNIFLFGFIIFLGVGVNRVTPPKTRIPSVFAIAVSAYLTIIIQRFFFWLWAVPV